MKKKLYILIIGLVIISVATSSFLIFFIPALLPNRIGIGSNQEKIDYLIITSESLLSAVEPLAIWKQQRGLNTAIVTVEEIADRYEGLDEAEKIRNCIKEFYTEKDLKWVLLAGNREFIPTRAVKFYNNHFICDQYYTNLDDNWILNSDGSVSLIDQFDWDLDVYIGRLPAEDKEDLELLVQKLLEYEKNPPIGPWMTRAIFGGAYAHYSFDMNDNSIFDEGDRLAFDANRVMNWINNEILPSDWTSTLLAEAEGIVPSKYYYDIPLNEPNIVSELNSGAGICALDAHGLTVGMSRSVFAVDEDGDKLVDPDTDLRRTIPFLDTHSEIDANGKNGFFFLSACETGNFEGVGLSLTEYILQKCGIGCISSSRSACYDVEWTEQNNGGWVSQGLYTRFWKQLFLNDINQPGKAYVLAKLQFVEDYLVSSRSFENENIQTLIQYNLLGDPEVPLWMSIPQQLDSNIIQEANNLVLQAVCENQPVENVVVTLTNSSYYWKGYTDSEGELIIPVSLNELNELTLTLSKNNYLSYQKLSDNPLTSFPDYNS